MHTAMHAAQAALRPLRQWATYGRMLEATACASTSSASRTPRGWRLPYPNTTPLGLPSLGR